MKHDRATARAENSPVNSILLAEKLNRVHDFELPELLEEMAARPRLREALWFLQWVSRSENYPGGMKKFAADLIDSSQDLIGSELMSPARFNGSLTEGQVENIILEFPCECRFELPGFGATTRDLGMFTPEPLRDDTESEENWQWRVDQAKERRKQLSDERARGAAERARLVRETNMAGLVGICSRAAKKDLARYLRDLCELPHVRFTRSTDPSELNGGRAPWYFVRIAEALLRFMDGWTAREGGALAATSFCRAMWASLDRAMSTKRGVLITADTRHGKTEALMAWCRMRPGLGRYVMTPYYGTEEGLLRAVGGTLGLSYRLNENPHKIREEVGFVLKWSGLFIGFDEFHFAVPDPKNRKASRASLDFVRCAIMDAGLPLACVCTPQSYHNAVARFVKATGYNMPQFTERLRSVTLPDEVSPEDLTAIAQFHLPEADEKFLRLIVAVAVDTQRNYISDISNIAAEIRGFMAVDAATRPQAVHVVRGIEAVFPGRLEALGNAKAETPAPARDASSAQPRKASADPLQRRCQPLAESLPPGGGRRETAPALAVGGEV